MGAIHELIPIENGFIRNLLSGALKAIADGHTLHFAIEVVNGIKDAMASAR
ncbi:hypothetical protein [Neisseria dentiae]|uniref:hypothetical protein n=1 Tax=Neisseria dentiae TaxID=194197 RepID=UPI00359F90BE